MTISDDGALVDGLSRSADGTYRDSDGRVLDANEVIARLTQDIRAQRAETARVGLTYNRIPEDTGDSMRLANDDIPVLRRVPELSMDKGNDETDHVLIEGDNLPGLMALLPSLRGRVNVIYIDPPYNTGATDWVYNNKFIAEDDPFRHSKWLSLMEPRLRLARDLLADDGIICCTIDDYEIIYLGALMDEIFGEENKLGIITIQNNPSGRSTVKGISIAHEYALFYGKTDLARVGRLPRTIAQRNIYNDQDDNGRFSWANFRASYSNFSGSLYYPIFIKKDGASFRIPELYRDSDGTWNTYDDPDDSEFISWPIDADGRKRTWKWSPETLASNPSEVRVHSHNDKSLHPYIQYKMRMKSDDIQPKTIWTDSKYNAATYGASLLKRIIGFDMFSYPKSLEAVKDCIRVANVRKDSIVLDFFAGSGTTGHAVAELNKEDGGHRRAILVTNNFETRNDGSRRETGIARGVTAPRMKNVLTGDWADGKHHEALPGNLAYYRVGYEHTDIDRDTATGHLSPSSWSGAVMDTPLGDWADTIALGELALRSASPGAVGAWSPSLSALMGGGHAAWYSNEDGTKHVLILDAFVDYPVMEDIKSDIDAAGINTGSMSVFISSSASTGEYLESGIFDPEREYPYPMPMVSIESRQSMSLLRTGVISAAHHDNNDDDNGDTVHHHEDIGANVTENKSKRQQSNSNESSQVNR